MNLDLTRIFVKVAQNGSFSKAAALLNVPKSTVSKAVSKLERDSGTKLIVRTTRSLSLTAAGRVFFDSSLGPIQALEDAQKSLNGADSLISGLVRITAPEDLGMHVIAPVVARLTRQYPGLCFDLQYTDEVIDLVKDGYDMAVRIGRLNESNFKVRRAGEVTLIAVATPKYLSAHEKIRHPRDLERVDCLTYSDQAFRRWSLRSGKSTAHASLRIRASSNQMSSLWKMALADGGVALIPKYLCDADLKSGKLVRVLPEWSNSGMPVSLISPQASLASARLKVTMDTIFDGVKATLSQVEVPR